MAMIVADPPEAVRIMRPDVPVAVEQAILRCLEKDRGNRFGTITELARALAPYASPSRQEALTSQTIGIEGGSPLVQPSPNNAMRTATAWSGVGVRTMGRRATGITAVLVGVGSIGTAVFLLHPAADSESTAGRGIAPTPAAATRDPLNRRSPLQTTGKAYGSLQSTGDDTASGTGEPSADNVRAASPDRDAAAPLALPSTDPSPHKESSAPRSAPKRTKQGSLNRATPAVAPRAVPSAERNLFDQRKL
jgi:serine/threonine-protein kinase